MAFSTRSKHSLCGANRADTDFFQRCCVRKSLRESTCATFGRQFYPLVYSGWLWKQNVGTKKWVQRYFVLRGATLSYYTRPCVIDSVQLGARLLDVTAEAGVRIKCAQVSKRTEFGLEVIGMSEKHLQLQAGDLASREQWIAALQAACKQTDHLHTQSDNSSSYSDENFRLESCNSTVCTIQDRSSGLGVRKGWVFVRSSVFKTWRRRYLRLIDCRIYFEKHPNGRSRHKHQQIDYAVSVTFWIGHENALHVKLERDKDIYFYTDTLVESIEWLDAIQRTL
uniref:Uncharacterized protein AlNc14C62G4517 n=1 Tax=Albugo laibachii Nc14 TaxID=890382 RepID=F0WCZ3_9STRA|nr:conserved hypothetical protein [Albugo laibachii Nc14]|eukprot:CCA19064.1 conserved hypothetical protein [Albugo laibachii Nc14]